MCACPDAAALSKAPHSGLRRPRSAMTCAARTDLNSWVWHQGRQEIPNTKNEAGAAHGIGGAARGVGGAARGCCGATHSVGGPPVGSAQPPIRSAEQRMGSAQPPMRAPPPTQLCGHSANRLHAPGNPGGGHNESSTPGGPDLAQAACPGAAPPTANSRAGATTPPGTMGPRPAGAHARTVAPPGGRWPSASHNGSTHPRGMRAGSCPPGAKSTTMAHGVASRPRAAMRPAAATPKRTHAEPQARPAQPPMGCGARARANRAAERQRRIEAKITAIVANMHPAVGERLASLPRRKQRRGSHRVGGQVLVSGAARAAQTPPLRRPKAVRQTGAAGPHEDPIGDFIYDGFFASPVDAQRCGLARLILRLFPQQASEVPRGRPRSLIRLRCCRLS